MDTLNITIKQGNSWSRVFLVKHNGEPLVLDDTQKILFDIKADYEEAPIIHKDISGNTTETPGEYIVSLKPSETDGLDIGTFYVGIGLQTGTDDSFLSFLDGTLTITGTAAEREV